MSLSELIELYKQQVQQIPYVKAGQKILAQHDNSKVNATKTLAKILELLSTRINMGTAPALLKSLADSLYTVQDCPYDYETCKKYPQYFVKSDLHNKFRTAILLALQAFENALGQCPQLSNCVNDLKLLVRLIPQIKKGLLVQSYIQNLLKEAYAKIAECVDICYNQCYHVAMPVSIRFGGFKITKIIDPKKAQEELFDKSLLNTDLFVNYEFTNGNFGVLYTNEKFYYYYDSNYILSANGIFKPPHNIFDLSSFDAITQVVNYSDRTYFAIAFYKSVDKEINETTYIFTLVLSFTNCFKWNEIKNVIEKIYNKNIETYKYIRLYLTYDNLKRITGATFSIVVDFSDGSEEEIILYQILFRDNEINIRTLWNFMSVLLDIGSVKISKCETSSEFARGEDLYFIVGFLDKNSYLQICQNEEVSNFSNVKLYSFELSLEIDTPTFLHRAYDPVEHKYYEVFYIKEPNIKLYFSNKIFCPEFVNDFKYNYEELNLYVKYSDKFLNYGLYMDYWWCEDSSTRHDFGFYTWLNDCYLDLCDIEFYFSHKNEVNIPENMNLLYSYDPNTRYLTRLTQVNADDISDWYAQLVLKDDGVYYTLNERFGRCSLIEGYFCNTIYVPSLDIILYFEYWSRLKNQFDPATQSIYFPVEVNI